MVKTPPSQIASDIEKLAERILNDIRSRGLLPGDRYLTAEKLRSELRVGKIQLNEALKLLTERQILTRKRKSGTFIGPGYEVCNDSRPKSALDVIHVLMPLDYYRANIIPGTMFVDVLMRLHPGCSVQIHHIASQATAQYTKDLLETITAGDKTEGIVLLLSSHEAQRAAQESAVPVVIFGTTYPGITQVPSIDLDQSQAGRLAARYALEQGHSRFALIMRNQWRRGDNLLMDGFANELGEHGIGISQLTIASSTDDLAVIEHDVNVLLSQTPYPTAFICRSHFHAQAAVCGAIDSGLKPGKDVLVIALENNASQPSNTQHLSIAAGMNSVQQIEVVGKMLIALAQNQAVQPMNQPVSVQGFTTPA